MANTLNAKQFQQRILTWFEKSGRKDLPWQKNISAYRVWVSEIMLQQTQVKTVIPYYQRFMRSFPSVRTLALAENDEVMHHWTGLGYYARARNLHKAALVIHHEYNDQFPAKFDEIIKLPGIGRSTAGAICAIAYQQPYAILDGNVKRVLARFAAIEGWPGKTNVHDTLWQIAEQYTPHKNVAAYTQAMMDLGAMICTRTKPQCGICPLQASCIAYAQQKQHLYPGKKPKKTLPIKSTVMLLIRNQHGELLLQKQPPAGIWGGLWIFPQCKTKAEVKKWCALNQMRIDTQQTLSAFRHTFSHYHLDIQPILIHTTTHSTAMDATQRLWYNKQQSIGLAAPVKKLLEQMND